MEMVHHYSRFRLRVQGTRLTRDVSLEGRGGATSRLDRMHHSSRRPGVPRVVHGHGVALRRELEAARRANPTAATRHEGDL